MDYQTAKRMYDTMVAINKADARKGDVISYPSVKLVKHDEREGRWHVEYAHGRYYYEMSDKELGGLSDLVEW